MKHPIDALTAAEQNSRAALRSLWDIQAAFLRKSAYLQFSLATIGFEGGMRQWQSLQAFMERDRLIAGQKEIADSLQPRLMAVARESAESLQSCCEQSMSWLFGAFVPDAPDAPEVRRMAPRPKRRPSARRQSGRKRA
jgi:hypothetical protein